MSVNHGTRSGYYAHRRQGTKPCQECRNAINQYVREYRKKKDPKSRGREGEKRRRQAMSVLRDRHRSEYEQILKELTDREGE